MMAGQTREMRGESPDRLPVCREMINQVILHLREEFGLPMEKIIVGGFSQGSMLATDVALHLPHPVGGLIVWSGALINEPIWREQAQRQQQTTVVQTHGRTDPLLPISGAEDLVRDIFPIESG